MRFIALTLLLCVGFFLSACTNHSLDYLKKSGQVSPIVVPSTVPAIKQEPYFPVPPVSASTPKKPMSLKPPTLQ